MGPLPRATSWLLTLYLGTAPVQWLPGIHYDWLAPFKVLLFVVAVGLVFVGTSRSRLRLPGGLAGPLGFAALAALAVPGLAQSSLVLSAGYVLDVVSGQRCCGASTTWRGWILTRQRSSWIEAR